MKLLVCPHGNNKVELCNYDTQLLNDTEFLNLLSMSASVTFFQNVCVVPQATTLDGGPACCCCCYYYYYYYYMFCNGVLQTQKLRSPLCKNPELKGSFKAWSRSGYSCKFLPFQFYVSSQFTFIYSKSLFTFFFIRCG